MKKKICIMIGVILGVIIIAGIITNYVDSGRVGTWHEPKYCIKIVSNDGSKVKINIPLEFIKIMGGIGSMYSNELEKYNIDIEKLMNAIDNGFVGRLVDVESGNDKVVVEIG